MGNFNYEDTGAYNPNKADQISQAFTSSGLYHHGEGYQIDMEHGQYWVTELGTGKQWSVVETNSRYGFDFELVTDGER